jgi:sec-independent protein translocase protein TatC
MPQDEQDKKSVSGDGASPEAPPHLSAYDHPGAGEHTLGDGSDYYERANSQHDGSENGPNYPETVTLDREPPERDNVPAVAAAAPPPPPPPPPDEEEEEDEDEEGMLRMSFLDHLEELRTRLIRIVVGMVVAYGGCLLFAKTLWFYVQEPAAAALRQLGFPPDLAQLKPMDAFLVIYVKLPLLAALFVASPWILWQIWAFIAPGLYKRERKYAGPFVICTAGLFILGGCFAYFVAFRFGLTFLLGVGNDVGIKPVVDIVEYFDLFVNVMLGIGATFELPILIFFLTMLRIVTPKFLIEHSRYAILGITVLAAVITPTPDIVNLLIFAIPMILLYFVGVFAGYLLVLSREGKRFPWHIVLMIVGAIGLAVGGIIWALVTRYGYKLVTYWPYVIK